MVLRLVVLAALAMLAAAGCEPRAISTAETTAAEPSPAKATAADENLVRRSEDQPVWLDKTNKQIVMQGEVCLTQGQLEMFACPKGTKEHESIVAVPVLPRIVHAGLLALGA